MNEMQCHSRFKIQMCCVIDIVWFIIRMLAVLVVAIEKKSMTVSAVATLGLGGL